MVVEDEDKYGEGAKHVEFHGKIKAKKGDTEPMAVIQRIKEELVRVASQKQLQLLSEAQLRSC